MSFKTRIKELRARYDLTQEELAKKVGVRRETIIYLEKGMYNPSLRLAYEVAKVLKTTIDDLFIFEEDGSKSREPISTTEVSKTESAPTQKDKGSTL